MAIEVQTMFIFVGRKKNVCDGLTNSFSQGLFFLLPLRLYLGACKVSAQSIGYRKSLNAAKVCMVAPVARVR